MGPVITADDVIRAGACREGVMQVIGMLGPRMAAAMSADRLILLLGKEEAEAARYILRAASLDGYGYGDYGDGGYGYGYGDGDGDGGYGYGYGCGDGGYGDGGYGYGYGYGDCGENDE